MAARSCPTPPAVLVATCADLADSTTPTRNMSPERMLVAAALRDRLGPGALGGDADAVTSLLQLAPKLSNTDRNSDDRGSSSTLSIETIPSSIEPQTTKPETTTTNVSAQARHNATERRRVQKLKSAYIDLKAVLRCRPDLLDAPNDEPELGRKRSRTSTDGDGGWAPAEPSHLAILQEAAEGVRRLYSLVDQLAQGARAERAELATTAYPATCMAPAAARP